MAGPIILTILFFVGILLGMFFLWKIFGNRAILIVASTIMFFVLFAGCYRFVQRRFPETEPQQQTEETLIETENDKDITTIGWETGVSIQTVGSISFTICLCLGLRGVKDEVVDGMKVTSVAMMAFGLLLEILCGAILTL